MATKDKAKCEYFEQLFGLPSRYGIICYDKDSQNCKEMNFPKNCKNDRDIHFYSLCCGNSFYMCPNYPVKYPNGWLSPRGRYYKSSYYAHTTSADNIIEELRLAPQRNEYGNYAHGEELLEILGWIKLYADPSGEKGHIYMWNKPGKHKTLSSYQLKYLDKIKDQMVGNQIEDYQKLLMDCSDI